MAIDPVWNEAGPEPTPRCSPEQRRAEVARLRAVLLARQRRFAEAREAFALALSLDPELDLQTDPAFWKLERGAHLAAVEACRDAGRDRDAAILQARIDYVFRPRLVVSRPAAGEA